MKLLDLLFALIKQFVPINPSALAEMEREGRQWELSLKDADTKDSFFARIYLSVNEAWYWRLCWAVLFVPLSRYLTETERSSDGEEL